MKKERPSQEHKPTGRPAARRKPLDPVASKNRLQKEARLKREEGLKNPRKKDVTDPTKSIGKKDTPVTKEHFAKKFMKKPLESDRPEKSDAPPKYSRATSRSLKKTEDHGRPERGEKRSTSPRSDSKFTRRPSENDRSDKRDTPSRFTKPDSRYTRKPIESEGNENQDPPNTFSRPSSKPEGGFKGEMRLNKYLAHCGIASRRAVDVLIMQGLATVNGVVVQEMGHKVKDTDIVTFKGKVIRPVDKLVYYLLNKPRNVITTSSDERGRKTVIDIIAAKVPERIYPVGRLDRNTSGLILLTNDGELTKKLSHPSHKVPKVYLATLDKNLSLKDLEQIRDGITLEDGEIKADSLHYVEGLSKREVQIEIHSGRNRLVRRIFEHLGYEVVKLDRTYYAGLTKKNLPRGMWRPLTHEEVRMLKHFS